VIGHRGPAFARMCIKPISMFMPSSMCNFMSANACPVEVSLGGHVALLYTWTKPANGEYEDIATLQLRAGVTFPHNHATVAFPPGHRGPLYAGGTFLSPTAPAEGWTARARRWAPVVHSVALRSLHPTYHGCAAIAYVVGLRPSIFDMFTLSL
jgi:hypothetical protein